MFVQLLGNPINNQEKLYYHIDIKFKARHGWKNLLVDESDLYGYLTGWALLFYDYCIVLFCFFLSVYN